MLLGRLARTIHALRRAAAIASLLAALGAVAGCGTAADAGRSFGSGELASDMAARLSAADDSTYTAIYLLSNEQTATMAREQVPIRAAYIYPTGRLLLAPDRTVQCHAQRPHVPAGCTITAATPFDAQLPLALDAVLEGGGLIRPDNVATMLNEASLNNDAIISEHDTTIAGTNATCVTITGVPVDNQFSTCVTSDGLLASFVGQHDGRHVDMSLDRFTLSVVAATFAPPAGVTITGNPTAVN